MIKRWKTREEREEERRSQTTLTKERERERANGSLSAFTHFFSELVILALTSSKKRAQKEKREIIRNILYISFLYKKPLNTRRTTETKRKKDEEIVHTLALFFATDDILVAPLFTSTREFESIIIIVLVFFSVYVAIKVRQKTEILEGDFLEV